MVSKASDDFPEPDSRVKTTSLSRGISRSMFLRLCSRAPRIVIARVLDQAVCWRLALITSSISAFPGAWPRLAFRRAPPELRIGRQWVSSEHRKNAHRFPVPSASHQRFVAVVAARAGKKGPGQAKGRREAGLFHSRCSVQADNQYLPTTGPPQR